VSFLSPYCAKGHSLTHSLTRLHSIGSGPVEVLEGGWGIHVLSL
jgi:hypothetical protein